MRRLPRNLLLAGLVLPVHSLAQSSPSAPDSVASADTLTVDRTTEFDKMVLTYSRRRALLNEPRLEPTGLEPTLSIVDEERMVKQNAKTATEAMQYLPSSWTETRGRKVKQFVSFRATRYPYPDYTLDGVWNREFHELPYFFSTMDIERIEVIRSSAALLNGLTGLVGVINIIPKNYDSLGVRAQVEYGSFNSIVTRASHGNQFDHFGYAAGIGYSSTDGPDGRHAAEEMTTAYGRLKAQNLGPLSFQTNVFYLSGSRELAAAKNTENVTASPNILKRREKYDPFSAFLANFRGTMNYSDRLSTEMLLYFTNRDHDFTDELTDLTIRERDYEYGLTLTQVFGLFDNNVLRIGGLYNHWVAPEGKRFWVGSPMDDHTFSLVAVDEHVVGDLSANIGIRANFTYLNEYGQFSMEGTTKGFGNVQPITDEWQEPQLNGNIGASYDASENLSIHANGATGIIQPRKGAFSDTDAELKNELRSKIDLGLKTSLPRLLSADFVLFGVVRKNGLGLSPDTYEDPSTNLVFEKYNNRDYYQMGVELDLHSARLFDIIELFGNATYIRSLVDKDGDYEQNKEVPSVILGAGAMAEWLGFDANVFTKYVGPYENDRFGAPGPGKAPKWYPLGDYANIDITLGYAPRFLGRHKPRIYMAIENVTDNEYLTVIGYPDYGRRYAAGIQYGL